MGYASGVRRTQIAIRLDPDVLDAVDRRRNRQQDPPSRSDVLRSVLRAAFGLPAVVAAVKPQVSAPEPVPEPPVNAVVTLAPMIADAQAESAKLAKISALGAAMERITDAPKASRPAQRATGSHRHREQIPKGARCTGCHELYPFDCIGGADCRGRWELPPADDDFPTVEPEETDQW